MVMFQHLLVSLARALDGAHISYMVIGGQAVLLHGEPRLTRDIDVTVGMDASQLQRLLSAVSEAGLIPSVKDVESFVRTTNVLPLVDAGGTIRVDLIFSFTPYEAEAIRRAVPVGFEGGVVRYASVEDLIIHKMVAGRDRDIEDIRGVLARTSGFDKEYVDRWLGSFKEVVGRDLIVEFRKLT
jgi:hypothetical protein